MLLPAPPLVPNSYDIAPVVAVTACLPVVEKRRVESTIKSGSFGNIGRLGTDTLNVDHET